MSSKNLTSYYVWAIKALVFVLPFLSLWISSSMFFPYITGRNFAFRILIEIAFVLWLALIILRKEYRPKMTPILWAVLAFVAIIGIADFLGTDSYNSFWSRLERMEGYLMILHLGAYFLILSSVFRTKKEWLALFNVFVIAGILVGGYGVLQILGLKEAIQGGGVRIDGTIGNPTYLAAYLTLVITAALILLFNSEKRWLKYFYGSAVLFSFAIIYFSATRGAALSFLVAIPIFLLIYIFLSKKGDEKEKLYKKLAIAGLILIVLAPLGLWLARNTSLVENNEVLSRFTSISLDERTIKSRFFIWGIAWKAFKERPILGWGQENFLEAFSKYYDPRLYDQEPWFDRPHNIVFEWLINGGIIGLLSYLALFGTLFWGIGRLISRKEVKKGEAIVLVVAPIAYFIQNFFVFDNFNTYVLFFGLLAYVNRMAFVSTTAEKFYSEEKQINPSLMVLAGGLVAASLLIYFANIKPIRAAQGIIGALAATADNADPAGKALNNFKKVLELKTFASVEALEQLARTANLLVGSGNIPNQAKIPFLQFTLNELERYLKANPKNIRLHLMTASIYQSARVFNQELVFKAREHIAAALELSPTKQQILFLAAENYLSTNELDKAIELLEKAVELELTNREAHVNLATVGIFTGRSELVENVIKELDKIRAETLDRRNPPGPLWNFITDLNRIADVYLQVGQPEKARGIYNRIKALELDILAFKDDGVTKAYRELLKNLDDRIRE